MPAAPNLLLTLNQNIMKIHGAHPHDGLTIYEKRHLILLSRSWGEVSCILI